LAAARARCLLRTGMRLPLKQGWQLAKQAVGAWSDDYAPSMGAAIAYYTLFSIAPLLLIVISVAGFIFGDEAVRGELTGGLQFLMGEEGAKAVEGLLASVSEPKEGIIATVIGVFVLLLGATTVFGELQNALDRIWRAPAREDVSGLWRLLRSRLLSLGMILGIAFLLMVSLIFDMVLQGLGKVWGTGPLEAFAQLLNLVIGFGLTTTIFALIYKLMPRARIEWHDVWVGAAVTALLFTLGKFLISVYIGRSAVASSFGAAGSLVVVMIWVYYSAQIFLLGAEFTWVYSHAHGSRRGEKRPGAPLDAMDAPKPVPASAPAAIPVRLAPAPMPVLHMSQEEVPVLKRKPLYTFGAAAALGLLAGFLLRAETFAAKPRSRWHPRKSIFG
jgi:membrane protein